MLSYVVENYKEKESDLYSESDDESDNESDSESDNEYIVKPKSKAFKYKSYETNKINETNSNNEYIEYECDNFFQKIGQYTFGLDKVIPWEESNFVLSGGLLYDIITDRFDQNLMDIDLFFYGDSVSKHNTINKLLDNLDKEQYYYLIGYVGSVIYIFVQGIPRIIQLIMTNKTHPKEIIDSFDFTHIMSYSDGTKIFSNPITINQFGTKNTDVKIIHKNRIIKYFERGLNLNDVLLSDHNFVIDDEEKHKIIKSNLQKKLYSSTYNLTRYPNDLTSQIDFRNVDRNRIDMKSYFNCTVNYNKLDNHEFKNNVNMFGAFVDYLHLKPNNILKNCEKINDKVSKKVKIDNFKLHQISNSNYGKLFTLLENSSIYIPCKFIKYEKLTIELAKLNQNIHHKEVYNYNYNNNENNDNNNLDDNNETKYHQVIKIYMELEKYKIINYLKYKIDNILLLDNLNFEWDDNKQKKKLNKSKKELNDDKIFLPFVKLDNADKDNDLDKDLNNLIICSNLWGNSIHKFEQINDMILDKLVSGQDINCILSLSVYVRTIDGENIDFIDVNLYPEYIFTK